MNNWRTTTAGIAALIFAGWFAYKSQNELASAMAIIGFGFIAGKDAKNPQ